MTYNNVETQAVRGAIRALKAAGWELHSVWDGEERIATKTEKEAIEVVNSVGDSAVRFTNNGEGSSLFVVFGNNDKCDAIYDWGLKLDSVLSPLIDSWM